MTIPSLVCLRGANICTEEGYELVPSTPDQPGTLSTDLVAKFYLITHPGEKRKLSIFDLGMVTGCEPNSEEPLPPIEKCYINESKDPRNETDYPRACVNDEDKDDVINADDACPFDKGTEANFGCPPGDCRAMIPDADGDGHENNHCGGDDCDDSSASIFPGVDEITGNDIDENCNGMSDADIDGDGVSTADEDCNDRDEHVRPGLADPEGDGVDAACDGDADDDHFTVSDGDCNDHNSSIYPDAPETQNDGVDSDCSGTIKMEVGCPNSEYSSIQAAVDQMSQPREGFYNSIKICEGTYREVVHIDRSDIQLKGEGLVVLSGDGSERALTITGSEVYLENISFKNSRSSGDGGAILATGGRIMVSTSVFQDNAAVNGGAIAFIGPSYNAHSLAGISMMGNEATALGGAIYILDVSVNLKSFTLGENVYSSFTENRAGERGGLAYIENGSLGVQGYEDEEEGPHRFTDNYSPRGTAIFLGLNGSAAIAVVNVQQGSNAIELGNPGSSFQFSGFSATAPTDAFFLFINGTDESYRLSDFPSGAGHCLYDEGSCR